MASFVYATGNAISPSYGGIGWIDFGTLSIAPGTTTPFSLPFKDGSTVSFDLTNTTNSGTGYPFTSSSSPNWVGASFGNKGYTGIPGKPIFHIRGVNINNTLLVSNITIVDRFGNPAPNYYVFTADAEATSLAERASHVYVTNGTPWSLVVNLPPVSGAAAGPSIAGTGTTTVTLTGTADSGFTGPVFRTQNPTQLSLTVRNTSGQNSDEAIIFGFVIDTIILNKVVNNRYFANDQFDLSVLGNQTALTTTHGNTYGVQPVVSQIFGQNGESYVLNEAMAAGSSSLLSQYTHTIKYTNLSAGGTAVPTSTTIPGNITLALGDVILATITNSILPVTVTSSKTVSETVADKNDLLTYTVVLNNTGIISTENIVLIDTIPNGTTFVPGSLTQDGVPISGNPAPPSGANIGSIQANSTSTVTFQVAINNTIPNPNPIQNTASGNFTYAILPTTGVGGFNTNTTNTKVNAAIITSNKAVNKTYAAIGDVITYTIPIVNSGNATATNVVFIDTIPSGTTLVANSLKQDGVVVAGNPNPPGITLPNSIGVSKVSTITFQVVVNSIPTPNPIPNSAAATYNYLVDSTTIPNRISSDSTDTNTVTTQVNSASLGSITKSVDKNYVTCGDVVTYTIVTPNTGNTTALNVVIIDTIPNGAVLVPNSVTVNGVIQSGANPLTGINISSIEPGGAATITFKVTVQC